jgi:hypothetical protein
LWIEDTFDELKGGKKTESVIEKGRDSVKTRVRKTHSVIAHMVLDSNVDEVLIGPFNVFLSVIRLGSIYLNEIRAFDRYAFDKRPPSS